MIALAIALLCLAMLIRLEINLRRQGEERFKGIAIDALQQASSLFLQLAEGSLGKFHERARNELSKQENVLQDVLSPLKETLQRLEQERKADHSALGERLASLLRSEQELRTQTHQLSSALHSPQGRGRWGELQLKRVVELAGMVERCDFSSQLVGEERARPDMVVHLPGNRLMLVDAKVPLDAYLAAMASKKIEESQAQLKLHAAAVYDHIKQLSKKRYWEAFKPTPDFVILFLPAEAFFSAALEQDPTLLEKGADKQVILASPTTLIALLRGVAAGWHNAQIASHAGEIAHLGKEVANNLQHLHSHIGKLGKELNNAVRSFNQLTSSAEKGVFKTAKRLSECGLGDQLSEITQLRD